MLSDTFKRLFKSTRPSPRRAASRSRLRVEALEDRAVPATFTVSNTLDGGPGSLRQAVLDANAQPGADLVRFQDGLQGTIRLTGGQLSITDHLTIQGPGGAEDGRLTVSGNNASRVFHVGAGAAVTIAGLAVRDGLAGRNAAPLPGVGGGVLNQGSLTLADVVVSNNRAAGDAGVTISVGPYVFTGAALGGGVANLGTLAVTGSTFRANEALGGDGSVGPDFPMLVFPGLALGGGLYNVLGTANVADSHFAHNLARGGSHCTGSFAAIGGGGGVYNDAALTLARSSLSHNRAVGGNDSVSDIHNGHGLGGGLVSGSVAAAFGGPSASLAVSRSTFDHNEAVGGNNNRVTLPAALVSRADGPNDGFGGGIAVYQGSATIGQSQLTHNRAVGGTGSVGQNGNLGVGGGLFVFHFIGGVTATVSGVTIAHNDAVGGEGGDGLGGGLAAGGLGASFSGPGTVAVSASVVEHNRAQGGDGGNGQGGGVYNGAGSTVRLTLSAVLFNQARGGGAGLGQGGGVFNGGVFEVDAFTRAWIRMNMASDAGDDVFGPLTVL